MKNTLFRTSIALSVALFLSTQMSVAMRPDCNELDEQLITAFADNDANQARMLIARGASINCAPETFMAFAISNPNLELLKITLDNGPRDKRIYKSHLKVIKDRLDNKNTPSMYKAFDKQAVELLEKPYRSQ